LRRCALSGVTTRFRLFGCPSLAFMDDLERIPVGVVYIEFMRQEAEKESKIVGGSDRQARFIGMTPGRS
jgi:hypothetical protein